MASNEQPVCQIFSFQDCKASPDPIFDLPAQCLTPTPAPIVIDNGSFQTRAGWATPAAEFDSPRLLFRSVAARSRGAARSETQIGNDIPNLEPLRWLLKSQFDRNVVVNFEIQELIFDYVFTHLGIASEVLVLWQKFHSPANVWPCLLFHFTRRKTLTSYSKYHFSNFIFSFLFLSVPFQQE